MPDPAAGREQGGCEAREALKRMVEHTPADALTYEQVRELGRAALASPCSCLPVEQQEQVWRALGCAVEELERRHPLGLDSLTVSIIAEGRAALALLAGEGQEER